jgi:hypothetical protein
MYFYIKLRNKLKLVHFIKELVAKLFPVIVEREQENFELCCKVNTNVVVITGQRKPDGTLKVITLPAEHPLVDYYKKLFTQK